MPASCPTHHLTAEDHCAEVDRLRDMLKSLVEYEWDTLDNIRIPNTPFNPWRKAVEMLKESVEK